MRKGRKQQGQTLQVRGFVRAALVDQRTGEIRVGPWTENAITADGFQSYIVQSIGSGLTGKQVGYMQLATQTDAPSSSQTAASGEFEARKSTTNSFVANGTLRATASWATNEATQSNVGAVALYNVTSAGTAGSVATFASSAKSTTQTLNLTYEWRFS